MDPNVHENKHVKKTTSETPIEPASSSTTSNPSINTDISEIGKKVFGVDEEDPPWAWRSPKNVTPQGQISSEPLQRGLGKTEECWLRFKALFFPGAKNHLLQRLTEADRSRRSLYQKRSTQSIDAIKSHQEHKGSAVNEGLFLDPEQLHSEEEGDSHTVAAEIAVQSKIHEQPITLTTRFGDLVSYSFDETGNIVNNRGIVPTSLSLGTLEGTNDAREREKDHLTNIYVIDVGGQRGVIRSGVINSEAREKDFLAVIRDLHEKYKLQTKNPDLKLRIVSQQLNSFESESKLIDSQHAHIASINEKLKGEGIGEIAHINIPSNRWYHTTKALDSFGILGNFIKALAPKKLFKGEKLSKKLNLEGLGTYVKWAIQDFQVGFSKLKEVATQVGTISNEIEGILIYIKNTTEELKNHKLTKAEKTQLQNEIKEQKNLLEEKRESLKRILKEGASEFKVLEKELSEIKPRNPEQTSAYHTASLMRQMLESQLGIKALDRGKEGMVIQMLNDRLRITSALNCKSGLDRTGLWHAVKLSILSCEKIIGADRAFALVNEWKEITTLMNRRMALGRPMNNVRDSPQLKQKIADVVALREEILNNLINIGIPITTASTGMMGIKWNSGYQENLIPLNFLPSRVKKETGGQKIRLKTIPLVQYKENGEIKGLTIFGKTLITKFQKLRGS